MLQGNSLPYTCLMCGIAGVYNRSGQEPQLSVLRRMSRAIRHRGPDGEAFFIEGGAGLAHQHLRIIDLSDAALQPMSNQDGSLHIILNGEIYNYVELRPVLEAAGHVFVSQSDTEVLLHAYAEWGADCLQRLNGMFAFAVWDSRKQELFIARDRLGVKPLYYRWDGSTLLFASEIKALLAYPGVEARPHFSAITEYMNAMFTTGAHTWFEGVERLLPGYFMVASARGLSIRRWWDVPTAEDALGARPESGYIAETRGLLEDSVRLRLRSDVPLGAHLSGGLDSSAVVALLSRQLQQSGERVRTFSGAFSEGPAYDERKYVAEVVSQYNTEHSQVIPTASDLPALIERIVWHMDEPAAGPGILLQWAVCEDTRRAGVTVINGGQGGDEAWGGYFGYVPAYMRTLLQAARKKPSLLVELARSTLVLLGRRDTRSGLLRAVSKGRKSRLRPSATPGPWAGPRFEGRSTAHTEAQDAAGESGRSALNAAMYYDLKWYLPALLQVEDRMSMAFSLESRAPLLDYRLIELSAAVPALLKMKDLHMKHILKSAVKDLLPASIYRRTDKMGMPTPVAVWFRGTLADWIQEQLTSTEVRALGLLNPQYVDTALQEHMSGVRDRSIDLWKMLNLVVWWRLYISKTAELAREDAQAEQAAGAGV